MDRIFGKAKPAAPKPTLADATASMEKRDGAIGEKIQKLERELAKYTEQMKKMKDGPAKNQVKQRAVTILKQKKMYESQQQKTRDQQFNIEQIQFATEQMKETVDTVAAMKAQKKVMQKEFKKIDIGKIEDLQDDMADLLEQADEVQSVLGRSYGIDDVDDADLEAELAQMEEDPSLFFAQEEEGAGEADYLSLPSSGTSELPAAGEVANAPGAAIAS